jgi:hypothetical protein
MNDAKQSLLHISTSVIVSINQESIYFKIMIGMRYAQ